MSAAENAGFDVLITVDQGIQYQQNLVDRKIFVIYIRAANTDMPTLIPMVKIVLARIVDAKLGTLLTVLPLGSL